MQLNFFFVFFDQKLQKRLNSGRPSYRRSLQPSTENIQHLKNEILSTSFYFSGPFLPSWIRIRIANLDPDTDPATPLNPRWAWPCATALVPRRWFWRTAFSPPSAGPLFIDPLECRRYIPVKDAVCSLLRAEGFFCSLNALYRGPGICKLCKFFYKKMFLFISSRKFFKIFHLWLSKPWIRIGIQPKMLDPDPDQLNTDPKHWFWPDSSPLL